MSQNEIISRISANDQHELGRIYEQYQAEFLSWVARTFRCSSEDSKDIYQSAILILYDNIAKGKLQRLTCSVKTYLFSIGKNVAHEHRRKSARNARLTEDRCLQQMMTASAEMIGDERLFDIARNALAKMDEPRRRLIEMFYFERKSMDEISQILGYTNADTAKNQKCKAMAKLRAIFDEEARNCLIAKGVDVID